MYNVSNDYLDAMSSSIRKSSSMKITFHFSGGDVTFTNEDITNFYEVKTAHLIAGELPAINATITLTNLTGLFNPNDTTNSPNYHDQIVEGVRVTYYYGYEVNGSVEWIKGGEVYTDGSLSYDASEITTTITAYDYLSILDSSVYYAFSGTTNLGEIAENVIGLTDYPEDDEGNKKIKIADSLYDFVTSVSVAGASSEAVSAKEWLQDIAYAGCVQMYINRNGYLCLDNEMQSISPSQYTLTLANQSENPEHSKYQLPSTLTVELDTTYGSDIEVNVGGGGDELTISDNPYIVTTESGEQLRDRILDDFLPYRNEASITYRGEPALDVLDQITFDSDFATGLTGTIVESDINFDGTLSGALIVRYDIGENTPISVSVKSSNNFEYAYEETIPLETSTTLTCTTDYSTPTYQWYTYDNGSWTAISGATSSTLTINYTDSYFSDSDSVKFKCTVSDKSSATTTVSKIYYTKNADSDYLGVVAGTSVSDITSSVDSPLVGDVVLLDNTSDEDADAYGETYVYNGETWVVTENSDALSSSYLDALELSNETNEEISTSTAYTDALANNTDFTDELVTAETLEINGERQSILDAYTTISENVSSNASDISDLTTTVSDLETNFETELSDAVSTLNKSLDSANEDIDNLQSLTSEQTTAISENLASIAENASAIAQNVADIERKANTTDVNSAIASLNASLDTANDDIDNLETLTTNQGLSITQNASDISSLATSVDTLDDTVTVNTSNITQNATDISTKVSQTEFDSLNNTVTGHTTSITQNATDITSIASDVTSLENTVSGHTTSIEQNATDITLKADQTELDELTDTVTTQGTEITQNATDIALKANQTDLDDAGDLISANSSSITVNANNITSLTARVTENENNITSNSTSISANADAIELKANQTDLDDTNTTVASNTASITINADAIESVVSDMSILENTVTSNTSSITQNATSIATKVSQTDFDTLEDTVSSNTSSITQNATSISSLVSSVSTLEDTVTSNTSSITQNATDISTKVSQTEFDSLNNTVTGHTTSITQNATDISSVASDVTSLEDVVSGHTTSIEQNATDIALKANQTELDTLTDTVTTQGTEITQNATDIALKANQTDLDDAGDLISANTANITLNADAISAVVERVTQTESDITSNTTSIAQNATDIALKASQTDFDALSDDVSTNTANITINANSISSAVSRIDTVDDEITAMETSIEQNATDISLRVTEIDFSDAIDDLETEITENTTSITQNATSIQSVVSSVTSLEDTVTSNTSSITQNASDITTKVTYTSDDDISSTASLKVTAGEDGSSIMLNADDVIVDGSINANKLDVDSLMARDLALKDGGVIHSDYYNSDGSVNEDSTADSGVYMDSSGNLKAENAEFTNTSVSGKFTSNSLETFDAKPDIDSSWGLSQNITSKVEKKIVFTSPTTTVNDVWGCLAYSGSRWVRGGNLGYRQYSDDGINWSAEVRDDASWRGIAYGLGKFVLMGSKNIKYSSDGVNWSSSSNQGTNELWSSIAFGGDRFVKVNYEGYVNYSTDGTSWSSAVKIGSSNNSWKSIIYDGTKFVAVSYEGYVSYSTNGISWSTLTFVGTGGLFTITYGDGKYIVVGNKVYFYSTDLVNWTQKTNGDNSWIYCAYGDNRFVMISYDGYTSYSYDGVTWSTPVAIGNSEWLVVAFGGDKFIALGKGKESHTNFSDTYNITPIANYLSSLLSTLTPPSTISPDEYLVKEPLQYFNAVSGTISAGGVSRPLLTLKVSPSMIEFTDANGLHSYPTSVTLDDPFNITYLSIKGTSEENAVTNLVPKNGTGTGNIGRDSERFLEAFIQTVYADKIYGKTYAT